MPDLAQDFFKRDLDDGEWAQLGRQLASEDAVADRFLDQAAGYYASLGLPEPKAPRGSGGGGGLVGGHAGLIIAVLLGAVAGSAATWWWRSPTEPTAATSPSPGAGQAAGPAPAAVAPPPSPMTRASSAEPAPAPSGTALHRASASPLSQPTLAAPLASSPGQAREASPGFPTLAAVVELQQQGLVTARVLDEKGAEQRLLYAGVLEPGRWSFGWDGLDLTGRPVPPGTYTIEVQEGSRVLHKQVMVSARRGEAP